mmetsp:Transcript_4804/g.5474  ORF Transcript_4804/g.5474 Transcript_4804/m.5474 type:complete len:132 (+) Transcript_4804:286-681(+)
MMFSAISVLETEILQNLSNKQLRWRPPVKLTPLSYVPNHKIFTYFGKLNLHFIKESWAVREGGGLENFFHVFLSEAQAIARANVQAIGGNTLLSFKLIPREAGSKSQSAYYIISLSGDVALAVPNTSDELI